MLKFYSRTSTPCRASPTNGPVRMSITLPLMTSRPTQPTKPHCMPARRPTRLTFLYPPTYSSLPGLILLSRPCHRHNADNTGLHIWLARAGILQRFQVFVVDGTGVGGAFVSCTLCMYIWLLGELPQTVHWSLPLETAGDFPALPTPKYYMCPPYLQTLTRLLQGP